jgi:light-harvesting protein B-800-850 alpha chain
MNQGRIWCVVNPTVGLPLFLGSVAVTSLIVHYSVLSHTSWIGNYWQGAAKVKAAANSQGTTPTSLAAKPDSAFVISVAPSTAADGTATFVVTVAPNPAAAEASAAGPPEKLSLASPTGR